MISCLAPIELMSQHKSATEPTLVISIKGRLSNAALFDLCDILQQDCIGQYCEAEGSLVGPRSARWGAFDPTQFLMHTGRSLAYTLTNYK